MLPLSGFALTSLHMLMTCCANGAYNKLEKSKPKKHTIVQNGSKWLIIPRVQGHTLVKIVPHRTYLGAKLSFTHFEQQTLQRRLHIARITFHRMKPWFNGKHVLTSKDRANLWSTWRPFQLHSWPWKQWLATGGTYAVM